MVTYLLKWQVTPGATLTLPELESMGIVIVVIRVINDQIWQVHKGARILMFRLLQHINEVFIEHVYMMPFIICHLFNEGGAFSQRGAIVEVAVHWFHLFLVVYVLKDWLPIFWVVAVIVLGHYLT